VTRRAAASPQELYDGLVAGFLAKPGVTMERALQNDVLKINGKIFAFLWRERLVVKVPAAQAAALVASGEAIPFESGGRKMKEWAAVGVADAARWSALMTDAFGYVGSLKR
jgi:YjbR